MQFLIITRLLISAILANFAVTFLATADEQPGDKFRGGEVMERLQARGTLICNVDTTPGFAAVSAQGDWQGFEVDFCRAVAAALFADASAVEFTRLSSKYKFQALSEGKVDLVLSVTTWTLGRDRSWPIHFTDPLLYDGQGFLSHRNDAIDSLVDAKDATICVQENTTTYQNLKNYIDRHQLAVKLRLTRTTEERYTLFAQRACKLVTADATTLAGFAAAQPNGNEKYKMLDLIISREPLTPFVADSDPVWFDLVRWISHLLIVAEEHGVTQANVDKIRQQSDNPELRQILGLEGELGQLLGLSDDWGYQVIKQVGNYGEIFARNLTPLGLQRGKNALARDGGLLYSPPFR
ncbi:MAG: transporter substrate-binding domain-containing protein [Gammaproteobacteria bacterium]|nr:transporter substrate-binding domain-containing protein [Gammaproteobacteria bacterium]